MATQRNENRIVRARVTPEGDGVTVQRLFPTGAGRLNRDPFVLFDHFDIQAGCGFPTHPHRGFEAITYLFSGGMRHRDNLGNDSVVRQGGAQRFTAGRGMEHSEMPVGASHGIQLWINLPRHLKRIAPQYQSVDTKNIPRQQFEGGEVRTIVGDSSPVKLHTPVHYASIHLDPGGRYALDVPASFQGLVYLVAGDVKLGGRVVSAGEAMYLAAPFNSTLVSVQGAHVMLCLGKPHHQPIYQHGPYVD